MKKIDLLIILGLIASLSVVLGLRVESVSQQTAIVLENQELIQNVSNKAAVSAEYARRAVDTILINQELIKAALDQSKTNNDEIKSMQQDIFHATNTSENLDQFLRANFNESYLANEYRQYQQTSNILQILSAINIGVLNRTNTLEQLLKEHIIKDIH